MGTVTIRRATGCEFVVAVDGRIVGTILAHPITGACASARSDGQPAHDVLQRRIWSVIGVDTAYPTFVPPRYVVDLAGALPEDEPIIPTEPMLGSA